MFAVGLFAHFDKADGIAAFLDVGNLSGGIFGSAVEHRDGNHRGQIVSHAAGEEQIEPSVLIVAAIADVFRRMPGIDGGGAVGCRTLTGPFWRRCEFTACIATAKFDLLDCIADTVTNVPWIVLITSVRRFRHHNAYVARRNRRVCKLENLRYVRSEEHTSELQSLTNLVCRLLLEKKKKKK